MEHIKNRKAYFEYEINGEFTAGLVLTGTEVKSVRAGQVNMGDAYCTFNDGRLIVKNLHISVWKGGGFNQHNPLRERYILLNRHELKKIRIKINEKGFTLIPLEIFCSERGHIKMKIGLGRGKKKYDKRESEKEKAVKRDQDRGE